MFKSTKPASAYQRFLDALDSAIAESLIYELFDISVISIIMGFNRHIQVPSADDMSAIETVGDANGISEAQPKHLYVYLDKGFIGTITFNFCDKGVNLIDAGSSATVLALIPETLALAQIYKEQFKL